MNNQREIYEALLEGETLVAFHNSVKLICGRLTNTKNGDAAEQTFQVPANWHIYKEPKWYENIPDGGVLCWCKDGESDKPVFGKITEKGGANGYYTDSFKHWIYAEPLTKAEIKTFMDNAPED